MYKLEIQELKLKETESLDSIVEQISLFITFLDDRYFYILNLPEPDPENYIPLDEITDEVLEQWFWDNVNREDIDKIFVDMEKQKATSAVKQSTNGDQKYKVKDHVKQWKPDKSYDVDTMVYYEWDEEVDSGEVDEEDNPIMETVTHKKIYKVTQPHTSQTGWNPRDTSALFTDIVHFGDEGQVGYPDWQQPQGAHDAYPKNSIVSHSGSLWQSEVEANTWEPPEQWKEYKKDTVYEIWKDKIDYTTGDIVEYNGTNYIALSDHTSVKDESPDVSTDLWDEYTEDPVTTEPVEWSQPSGSHDSYSSGEQVSHSGSLWESNVDGNVWEPPTQWTEIV